jgi:hypothetical protein
LRILVDLRKAEDAELMASIGHELQHAIEVLTDRTITSDGAIYLFYERTARHSLADSRLTRQSALEWPS